MKSFISLGIVFLATLAHSQVKLSVVMGGKAVGTATITQKLRPDGSKQVMLALEIKAENASASFRSESVYASNGAPVRKYQESNYPMQKMRQTRIATFDSKGVNLVEDNNGQRKSKQYPLDPKTAREDLSEFWFLRDKPKKGDVSKAFTFNMDKLEWELVETTYGGQVEITIDGKKVKAHKTTSQRGVAYFDDIGMPLRLEVPGGLMERI